MTTDADRQRAREIAQEHYRPNGPTLVDAIAAAIAAARADGWREGIEAAAQLHEKLALKFAYNWFHEQAATAIRAIPQPQEPPHAP